MRIDLPCACISKSLRCRDLLAVSKFHIATFRISQVWQYRKSSHGRLTSQVVSRHIATSHLASHPIAVAVISVAVAGTLVAVAVTSVAVAVAVVSLLLLLLL